MNRLRILHFGDIHLPPPPGATASLPMIHPKRLPALLNYAAHRGGNYRDGEEKLNALGAYLREHPVDWILYSGDSVNFGLRSELIAVAPKISGVLSMARRGAIAVPGNHDLYTPASAKDFPRWMTFGNGNDLPEAAVAPGGFPRVRFLSDEVVCVSFTSAVPHWAFWDSSGRVPAREVAALRELLDNPAIAKMPYILLLTHYPLDEAGFFHGLRNANEMAPLLRDRPNLHLLHGHNHKAYMRYLPGTSVPLLCAGSLTKRGAESFWLYEPMGGSLNPRRGTYEKAAWRVADA